MGVSDFKLNMFPSVHVRLFTSLSAFIEADRLALKVATLGCVGSSRKGVFPDILKTSSVYFFRCSCFMGQRRCDSLMRAGAVGRGTTRARCQDQTQCFLSFTLYLSGYRFYFGNVSLQNYIIIQSHLKKKFKTHMLNDL